MASDQFPGDVLFRALDYEGVEVRCSREHWASKIERDHPDVAGREQDVAEAIERPTMVLQDRDHPRCKHHMARTGTGHWLYETEQRSGQESGSVLTVFLHRRLRVGDTVLYPRRED